ncbi:MAG: B12-binding domain-containing radical SAM protein [Candidatus Omnitrophica bacterium]|nr:B12-binding domain-containing radical SAM protein [Candidatus Omnitrophota bacterium]
MNKCKRERIVLINPTTQSRKKVLRVERCQQRRLFTVGLWPPVTLLEIATYLQYCGYNNIAIIDAEAENYDFTTMIQRIVQEKPVVVIVSTTTPTLEDDVALAMNLKKFDNRLIVIACGIHATLKPNDFLGKNRFDFCTIGEPEIVVCDLLEILLVEKSDVDNVKSVAYLDNDEVHITEKALPRESYDYPIMPDRTLLKNDLYRLPFTRTKFTTIKISRGCDYGCMFCTSASYYGKGWKTRSVSSIIAEIKDCIKKYNIKTFLFLSDTFNARKEFVEELCSSIQEEKLDIRWVVNSRIDLMDESSVITMKKAGCILVSLGIESFDTEVQKINKKNLDITKIDSGLKALSAAHIYTYGYFIIGLYGDSIQKTLRTIYLAWKSPLDFACFYSVTPYPGTAYYDEFKSEDKSQYFHGDSTCVKHGAFTPLTVVLLKLCAYIFFYFSIRRLRLIMTYVIKGRICY